MPGFVTFQIDLATTDIHFFPEIEKRLKDMTPAFDAIIEEWTYGGPSLRIAEGTAPRGNVQKFILSRGKEGTGIDFPGGPHWWGLASGTMARKRSKDLPDWLMVETGDTLVALTNRGLFEEHISPQSAEFGLPLSDRERRIVGYQWENRQAIFLGYADQMMIRGVKYVLRVGM